MKVTVIIVVFVLLTASSLFFDSSLSAASFFSSLIFDGEGDALGRRIFWLVRVPRVLSAVLVGALLAYAGVLSQGLFRNDLASPSVLGTVSGASFGGVLAFAFGYAQQFVLAVPLGAILGCFLSCCFLLAIVRQAGSNTQFLLLVGIALNAFIGASTSFLLTLLMAKHQWASNTFFWLLGGLNAVSWSSVGLAASSLFVSLLFVKKLADQLDVLSFGEEWSQAVGIDVQRLQFLAVSLISLTVGFAVAIGGAISFVGLIAPHITRELVGPKHRGLFIYSLLNGATLVVVADLLARNLLFPQELQLGILTAFVGGLFFVYLLFKKSAKSYS